VREGRGGGTGGGRREGKEEGVRVRGNFYYH